MDASGIYHGFARDGRGTIDSFDPAGSVKTFALSINDGGEIAGYYIDANLVSHGFLRKRR